MGSGLDCFIMYTNWWMIWNVTLFQLTMIMDDIATQCQWLRHDISTDVDVWILDHGSYLTLGGYSLLINWRLPQVHQGYGTNMATNHRWDFQMLFLESTNLIHILFQFLFILQMTSLQCCYAYNTSHRIGKWFCCALFCCGCIMSSTCIHRIDLAIFFGVASLTLGKCRMNQFFTVPIMKSL